MHRERRRDRARRALDAERAPADEWFDLLERSAADRVKRAMDGESELVERSEVLLPDRQSAELAAAARRNVPSALNTLPLEYVDETLGFHPEWVVDKIAPRPILFITTDDDRLVPPEESEALYARAGEPKKLVVLKGYGTTRCTWSPPSARSWTRPSPGSGSTCRPCERAPAARRIAAGKAAVAG